MSKFKVPKEALPTSTDIATDQEEGAVPAFFDIPPFQPPENVARELGKTAGNTSDAEEILSDKPEPEIPPASTEIASVDNQEYQRARRNFSFTSGETSFVFDRMPRRKKQKALKLREKLIERFDDANVNDRSIALFGMNTIDEKLFTDGGAIMYAGSRKTYDQYYLAHISHALKDRRIDGHPESEDSSILYRGLPQQVFNLKGSRLDNFMLLGGRTIYWINMVPHVNDDEWLPTVRI